MILYRVFPKFILGMQTNFVYYAIASLWKFSDQPYSFFGSVFLLISTLILTIISLKKGTMINNSFQEIFKKIPFMKILLLTGLIYDIALSLIIITLPNHSFIQLVVLIVFEFFYMGMIVKSIPDEAQFIRGLIFGQRSIFFIQIILLMLNSLKGIKQSALQGIILFFSFVSMIVSIVLISFVFKEILKKRKMKKKRRSMNTSRRTTYKIDEQGERKGKKRDLKKKRRSKSVNKNEKKLGKKKSNRKEKEIKGKKRKKELKR